MFEINDEPKFEFEIEIHEEQSIRDILKMWVDQCTETGFISNINYDGVKENSQPMIFTITIRYADFEGNNV